MGRGDVSARHLEGLPYDSILRSVAALLTICNLQGLDKKRLLMDDWERKLASVKIRKEDMNRLIMNFLVTEVRPLCMKAVSTTSMIFLLLCSLTT